MSDPAAAQGGQNGQNSQVQQHGPGHQDPSKMWYPSANNWKECRGKMAATKRRIEADFSGDWGEVDIAVKETRGEKLKDLAHNKAQGTRLEGRAGTKYKEKTVKQRVRDAYQDMHFPADSKSWIRGGKVDELGDLKQPVHWPRLMEFTLDHPYPEPDVGNENPRMGRVYQGDLTDFYLVQAMHAIGMKPHLVSAIFTNMEFSSSDLGFFVLRFYKHAQWQHIEIDDALPLDKDYNPLCCRTEFFPSYSWPSLIEKAYAKFHGSWEGVGDGGHVEEALIDLTGGVAGRFSTFDIAGDRLWKYFQECKGFCVWACNINETECSKRNIPVEKHWAAAIFDVKKYQNCPYICVSLTAPSGTVRSLPCCNVPHEAGMNYGPSDGYAWLRIDDFSQFFDTIYECRLVNSDLSVNREGLMHSPRSGITSQHLFEELWACADPQIYDDKCPSFLFDITQQDVPVELTLEVSQTDERFSQQQRRPQVPLLLRFYQCSDWVDEENGGEIFMVHMSSWGHCRDAMTVVKVCEPGKYIARVSMPTKYRCNRMIARCYSNRKLRAPKSKLGSNGTDCAMLPITSHKNWIPVVPDAPLKAIPYTMVGFARASGKAAGESVVIQMFDESDGKGQPLAGVRKGVKDLLAKAGIEAGGGGRGGTKTVGKFGGKEAVATVEAREDQASGAGCNVM